MWDTLKFAFVEHSLGIVFCTILYLAPVILYFRRKKEHKAFSTARGYEIQDPVALKKAEQDVRDIDLREQFLKNMIPIKKFQSIHGHDHSSLTKIMASLKSQGIFCDYYFDQSLPPGVFSYMAATGSYELFVEPSQVDEAKKILQKLLS